MILLQNLSLIILGVFVLLLSAFASAATYYWLGWPGWLRLGGSLLILPLAAGIWFWPGQLRILRRVTVGTLLAVFFTAYALKTPYPQTFVPLHSELADVTWYGPEFEVSNFRDSVHPVGAPAKPVWTTNRYNLDDLTGAQLILQPFGSSAATVHVMTSFAFANGDHLAVSFEARRTSWDKFDALAGFFRHDQLYAVLGTERDLFWKRLAHVPPNDLYFFDLKAPPEALQGYLRNLLDFVARIHDEPQFYSTVSESCFTTLLRLAPGIDEQVPWYDYRRWVPGSSIGLFQQLGLLDNSMPAQGLIAERKLRSGVRPPWDFESAGDWSRHLRSGDPFTTPDNQLPTSRIPSGSSD